LYILLSFIQTGPRSNIVEIKELSTFSNSEPFAFSKDFNSPNLNRPNPHKELN